MSAPSFDELMARETPKLLNCVHCGLCLDECPTYRLSGDEANSPRGRLSLWRAMAEGRLEADAHTDRYTAECLGCMACVSACPANVPYGELLFEARAERVRAGGKVDWRERAAAWLARRPRLFNALGLPLRLARGLGLRPHPAAFPGQPALLQGTAAYAARVNAALKPERFTVQLLAGCLMEAAYRDINSATVRVLAANGVRVLVPEGQACCGAIHEHAGLAAEKAALDQRNRTAFLGASIVLSNSSGCGLSLRHAVGERQRDAVDFLEHLDLRPGAPLDWPHAYYDFPCHAYHGQGLRNPPARLFKAAGLDGRWTLAPDADRCCGSAGAYMATHAENSDAILSEKSSFLKDSPHRDPVLVTANHVCMMQWSKVKGLKVKHAVQMLDESYEKAGYYSSL